MRAYLRELDDAGLRKVAFLFSRGLSDERVAGSLGITVAELEESKNRLRQGLLEAGVRPEG